MRSTKSAGMASNLMLRTLVSGDGKFTPFTVTLLSRGSVPRICTYLTSPSSRSSETLGGHNYLIVLGSNLQHRIHGHGLTRDYLHFLAECRKSYVSHAKLVFTGWQIGNTKLPLIIRNRAPV